MRNPEKIYWVKCDNEISTHKERGWKNDAFMLNIGYNWFGPGTNIANRPTAHLYINVHHKDDVFLCEPLIGVNDTFIPVPKEALKDVNNEWVSIGIVERDGHTYIHHLKDGESYLYSVFGGIKLCAKDIVEGNSNPSIKDFEEFYDQVYDVDDLVVRIKDKYKQDSLAAISRLREKIVATQARIERKCERCADALNALESEFGIKVDLDDPSLRHHMERCEIVKKYERIIRDNCPMYQYDTANCIEKIWSLFFDIHTAVIDALDEKGNDVIQLNSFQESINELQKYISKFEKETINNYQALEELSKWFEQFGCFAKV